MKQEQFQMGNSVSYFLVPFWMKKTGTDFEKWMSAGEGLWEQETQPNYRELARHINETVNHPTTSICRILNIGESMRLEADLPESDVRIRMVSATEKEKGEYSFYLTDVRTIYFATQIGFVILEVTHPASDTLQQIADKASLLSRFMDMEDCSDGKEESISCYRTDRTENAQFSLKSIILSILRTNRVLHADDLILFPTSFSIKECPVYHSLVSEGAYEEKQEEWFYRMCHRMHSSEAVKEESPSLTLQEDLRFGIYQNTVTVMHYHTNTRCLQISENSEFFLYLLALHERRALLWYNTVLIEAHGSYGRMAKLTKELLVFKTCFASRTVSDEVKVQEFYDRICDAFDIKNVQTDAENAIRCTEAFERAKRYRGIRGMLAGALAVLLCCLLLLIKNMGL